MSRLVGRTRAKISMALLPILYLVQQTVAGTMGKGAPEDRACRLMDDEIEGVRQTYNGGRMYAFGTCQRAAAGRSRGTC